MKRLRFNHVIIIMLLVLSVVFFILQQLLFHDMHESGFLFFQDLMFLPLHILLVTFILDRILQSREKREKLEQINIVIGAFFTETGTESIRLMSSYISDLEKLKKLLDMNPEWTKKDFENAAQAVKAMHFKVNDKSLSLEKLKTTLSQEKAYLLQMFSNPNLLEHNTFTDMLWALYHVTDELDNRNDLSVLPETDVEHLSNDIVRVFGLLVYEWIHYMMYLKKRYPYLWSLAVRKNPFADNKIIIT